MHFNHVPVLLEECIQYLNIKQDGIYIDGTIGGGGHSVEILKRLGNKGILVGLDQDTSAIEAANERLKEIKKKVQLKLIHTNFSNMKHVCSSEGISKADGILLDIGVSSHQLDDSKRGFSYNSDSLLDMRMDRTCRFSAEDVINEYSRDELKEIIKIYGEERWASRIALFIVERRKKQRIQTTKELVEIIKDAIPSAARRKGPHPAKRTFQAIRIAVNNELEVLKKGLSDGVDLLHPGGRMCIITFQSLEDRIVKREIKKKSQKCTCPPEFPVCVCNKVQEVKLITKKPVVPSEKELKRNPRARSAKLRVIERV